MSDQKNEDIELKKQIAKETALDWNDFFENISSSGSVSNKTEKKSSNNKHIKTSSSKESDVDFSPIIYEIGKYKFSSVHTQKEVEEIAMAVREVLRKRIVSKVVGNSKEICKYASDFYQTDDSIRGIFNILNNKYSMKATGSFCGEEYLYCAANEDKIVGLVLAKNNDEFVDISDKFVIQINELKK